MTTDVDARARELARRYCEELPLPEKLDDRPYIERLTAIIAAALREYGEELRGQKERMAPVQGYSAGIPWSMHLRAYDAYCKKYGKQQALIEGNCRGGFGTSELDVFVPGWRDELSEMNRLRTKLADAQAQAAAMREQVQFAADRLRMDAELTCIYDKVECRKMADEAEATLSTTAGRALLARVKELEAQVAAMRHDLETSQGLYACDNAEGQSLFVLDHPSIHHCNKESKSSTTTD